MKMIKILIHIVIIDRTLCSSTTSYVTFCHCFLNISFSLLLSDFRKTYSTQTTVGMNYGYIFSRAN